MTEKYSDKEIIAGLRSKNDHIVSYLYRRYMPMIRSMVLSYGGDEDSLKDVFQEGLYAILLKLQDPSFEIKHTFKTYFYAICSNQLNNALRKKDAESNYFRRRLEEDVESDIYEKFDRDTIEKVFMEVFEKFGKTCKTLLKLVWRELSLKEVSDILSISYAYARRKKSDCEAEMISRIRSHPSVSCIISDKSVMVES